MKKLIVLMLAFVIILPASFACASNEKFNIKGKVSGENGKVIEGAKIYIVTGKYPVVPVFETVSNANGNFQIKHIPVASPRYMLAAVCNGYFRQIVGNIGSSPDKATIINFKLKKFNKSEAYRGRKITIKMSYLQKVNRLAKPAALPKSAFLDKTKYPKKVLPYLLEGEGIEITQMVKNTAQMILGNIPKSERTNSISVARAVYEWIIQNIEYDLIDYFNGDVTCGNYQTTYGGFARDFFDWCYSPEEVLLQKRAICIEYERLSTALLRSLGIPARPTPLMAHPVTQFWIQPENGSGFWSNLEPSVGRIIYKNKGDKGAKFPSVPDSEIAIIPTGPNAPIHMKWDFGGRIWWREDYGQLIYLGSSAKAEEIGAKELDEFGKRGTFAAWPLYFPPEKEAYLLYSRGFEVDLAQVQTLHPVVKFPEFLENKYRKQLGMNWYVSIPEAIEKIWIEEEKNNETGMSQKWHCLMLDLTRIKAAVEGDN